MPKSNRELVEQARDPDEGRKQPDIGPSDSGDSASERPGGKSDTDSDAANTGERVDVENNPDETAEDLEPDYIVDNDGVASSNKERKRR